MNHQARLWPKYLVEFALHCEKILEEEDNEMNITTKSTHLMILHICKLMQENVEAYMNGTDDDFFQKRATLL